MDATSRKPAANLTIRLVAPGLNPWSVPTRTLSKLLEAVQRLVAQKDDADFESADDSKGGSPRPSSRESEPAPDLKLINIKKGSAIYQVITPHARQALRLIRQTGESLDDPSRSDWTVPTLSALRDLSDVASSLDCEVELRDTGESASGRGEILAKIGPATFRHVSENAFIHGDTTVSATIERVGGATAWRCAIRLPAQPQRLVYCSVESEEIVRELGKHIYRQVSLVGHATWLRHNSELRHFAIRSFEPPRQSFSAAALRRIYDAGGKAWDRVRDPDKRLSELRRE